MRNKTDVVKGKLKEVTGALTGNGELRAAGKADQAVGKVKNTASKGCRQGQEGREINGRVNLAQRWNSPTRQERDPADLPRGSHGLADTQKDQLKADRLEFLQT
ncbi:MAG: CsbD family protein [Pirellulaceae bacterium]